MAQSGLTTCLVTIIECYAEKADSISLLMCYEEWFILRQVNISGSTAPSCTRLQELIKQRLCSLGYDISRFGMYNIWMGGATAAVNTKILDCC